MALQAKVYFGLPLAMFKRKWGGLMISLKNTLEAIKTSVSNLSTDYIVEQGTSGIWTYRKWNSGIAECWGNKSNTVNISSAWGHMYYTGIVSQIPFPTNLFMTLTGFSATLSDSGGNLLTMARNITTTEVGIIYGLCPTNPSNVSATCYMYAIGTWK